MTSAHGFKNIFIIKGFDTDGNAVDVVEISGINNKRQFVGGVPLMTIEAWLPKKQLEAS